MTRAEWLAYLGERTGTYEFRCRRYRAVANSLLLAGIQDNDLIYDVGAGMCEFGRYMYQTLNWSGQYVAVDGAIDGTDLETWSPADTAHAFVCIEVIEHLQDPARLLAEFEQKATKVAVVTTPNAETVDVLGMDRTHVSPIRQAMLRARGWYTEAVSLFNRPEDTIIGVWRA